MNKYYYCTVFLCLMAGLYWFMNTKSQTVPIANGTPATKKIFQRIIGQVGLGNNKKVLDYGCGCGELVEILLQRSDCPRSILAVDSDQHAVDQIESLYASFISNGKLEARLANNPQELDGQKFDIIFCHNVLEYVQDPVEFVKNLYDLLEVNGVLIISHQDFDSEVFNSSFPELTRQLVHFFADAGEVGQTNCDGQIARKIPGIFKRAGIDTVQCETWRLVETTFTSNDYGSVLVDMLLKSAQQKFDEIILADWIQDLVMKAKNNDFYFAIDVMIARVQK